LGISRISLWSSLLDFSSVIIIVAAVLISERSRLRIFDARVDGEDFSGLLAVIVEKRMVLLATMTRLALALRTSGKVAPFEARVAQLGVFNNVSLLFQNETFECLALVYLVVGAAAWTTCRFGLGRSPSPDLGSHRSLSGFPSVLASKLSRICLVVMYKCLFRFWLRLLGLLWFLSRLMYEAASSMSLDSDPDCSSSPWVANDLPFACFEGTEVWILDLASS
jgi:hypothetical protein